MKKIDKEEFELMKSNCFWAGRLIDLPKEKSWEIAYEIVAAIQYAESLVKNHGVSHHVSDSDIYELLIDLNIDAESTDACNYRLPMYGQELKDMMETVRTWLQLSSR